MHSKTSQIDTEVQLAKERHIHCTLLAWQGGLEELCSVRQEAFLFILPGVLGSILLSCEHLSHLKISYEKSLSLLWKK